MCCCSIFWVALSQNLLLRFQGIWCQVTRPRLMGWWYVRQPRCCQKKIWSCWSKRKRPEKLRSLAMHCAVCADSGGSSGACARPGWVDSRIAEGKLQMITCNFDYLCCCRCRKAKTCVDLQARWLTGCLLGLVAANALLEDEVEASALFHFEFTADSPSILHFHPRSCFSYRGLAGTSGSGWLALMVDLCCFKIHFWQVDSVEVVQVSQWYSLQQIGSYSCGGTDCKLPLACSRSWNRVLVCWAVQRQWCKQQKKGCVWVGERRQQSLWCFYNMSFKPTMDKSWFGIGQPFFWPPFYQLFEEFALKSRASVHVLFGVLGTVDERHRGVILCQSSWGRCSMPWVGGWDVAHWMAVQIWMLVVFSFDLVVSSMYLLELADCTKLVHCYLSCCYPLWSVIFRFHTHLHWFDGLALCLDFSFHWMDFFWVPV